MISRGKFHVSSRTRSVPSSSSSSSTNPQVNPIGYQVRSAAGYKVNASRERRPVSLQSCRRVHLPRNRGRFDRLNISILIIDPSTGFASSRKPKMKWSTIVLVVAASLIIHHPATAQNDGQSCVNPRGDQGVCQNLRECPPLLALLKQYGNQVGEFLRQSLCSYDGRDPHVCCPTVINNNNNNNNNNQNNNNNNNNNNVTPQQATYGPLLPPVCGTTDAKYTRVVGGVPAKLGQWPWIAALGFRGRQDPNKPRWLCGGSLISARHVLTAGHCVYRRDDLYLVRVGDLDLENDNDGATPINIPIDTRTIHPQYSPTTYTNDIAVLRLQQEVQFTPLIRPLCLPVSEGIRHKNLENVFPFLVGWGSVYFNGPSSSMLQQIQVPIVSQEKCKEAFRNFKTATIDGRVLCAGYARGGKDACQGDSGGPLMYPFGKTYYAIGVVSYGFRCAEPGFPGVYTNTTTFLDFIIPLLN